MVVPIIGCFVAGVGLGLYTAFKISGDYMKTVVDTVINVCGDDCSEDDKVKMTESIPAVIREITSEET